jgi:(R,R)-butanediol dehydrogenase/meso-butanediol dehydrogenase/diacetyl reductase
MRAAIFPGVGQPLYVDTIADPVPAAGQVVLQVARCGICGSDLHATQFGSVKPGTVLGHEFAGSIAAIGSDVSHDWKIGDRVTALPFAACMQCEFCADGLHGLCATNRYVGISELPGGYAEFVAVRGDMLQRLPDGVGLDLGAMVEPLAVAYHAVERGQLRRGMNVLILGAGPIGVAAALFARLAGARTVAVSEFSADRRRRALELLATHVIDPGSEDVGARFHQIAGDRPDLVIECVGVPGVLQQALELVRPRGRVVIAGVCFEIDTITQMTGMMKEAELVFSQCYTPRDFEAVIDAIARGDADPRPMLTETIGFADLPERFEALRKPTSQCKILIDPSLA